MKRRLLSLFMALPALLVQANAQITAWDTIDLHSPLSNITAAAQLNDRLFCSNAFGISATDDYGEHWQYVPGGPERAYHTWTRDGNIYASRVWNEYDSTWVSTNGGDSFEYWGDLRCDNPTTKVIRGDTMFAVISGSGLYVERIFRKFKTAQTTDILFECPYPHYAMQITEMGKRLVVLCSDGIRWSDDSGQHWEHSAAFSALEPNYRLFSHQNALFLFNNDHQMFRSLDAGETWEPIAFFLNAPYFLRNLVAEGNDILATADGSSLAGLVQWRSSDLGETWALVHAQLFGFERNLAGFLTAAGKRFFTNKGCYAVSDNDQTWDTKNYGLPQDEIREAVRLDKLRWVMADESNARLFLTKNHGQSYRLVWQLPGYTILNLRLYGETMLALGAGPGFLRSDDDGETWQDVSTPNGNPVRTYCPENQNLLVNFNGSGDLYRYELASGQWTYLSNIGEVTSMAFLHGMLCIYGVNGIRVSSDYGNSFQFYNTGLPSYFEGQQLFAVGNNLLSSDLGSGLYLSKDDGVTWAYLPDPADGTPFPPFEEITGKGQVWYARARFSSKVFYSSDQGINWNTSPVPLQGFGYGAVTFMKQLSDSVYVSFYHKDRHYVIRQKNAGLFETGDPNDDSSLSFLLAPNPVQNISGASLLFPKGIPDNTALEATLFDPAGHLVLQVKLETLGNQATMPKIPKGVYYLKLKAGDKKNVGIVVSE